MILPAWTLFPICSSDICTDFPFSVQTFPINGKHDFFGGGGGGSKSKVIVSNFTII